VEKHEYKEKAFKALFEAGIITKTGRLRKVYRN